MKLTDYLATQPYQFNSKLAEAATTSQQTTAFTQENTLNFTTKEGDKVTLSQSFASAFSLMSQSENNANGTRQSLSAATLQYQTLSLQVEGDLNEEELADIQKLIKNLYAIAEDFFNGNQDMVLAGVKDLTKDTGTISNISASFYQTQMVTNYTSNLIHKKQPQTSIENTTGEQGRRLQNSPEDDRNDIEFVNELLKDQWRQISTMLDLYNTELHKKNGRTPEPADPPTPLLADTGNADQDGTDDAIGINKTNYHVNQMINTISATMRQHPRLQPFMVPLVNTVIDQVSELRDRNDIPQLAASLKNDFSDQLVNIRQRLPER